MAEAVGSIRQSLGRRALDALANLGVGLKMRVLLLCIGVLPPIVMLLVLHQSGGKALQNALALYIAGCVLLYYPFCKAMEELIVLRQTRRINTYVDEVKEGRRSPHFQLPMEKGDEHDFLRLQRNIFWMVQGLRNREAKLRDALNRLELAQRQVLESIEYASRIQRSFLPSVRDLREALGEHFLFWIPRDGVGGDAYWVKRDGPRTCLAVFDCTGHGVPGAFLTLIVNSLFEQFVDPECREQPARLLAKMNMGLKRALSQHGKEELSNDGLEGAVCVIDREKSLMHYAGARGFLFLAGAEGVREMRGDSIGVGFVDVPMDQEFVNHTVSLRDVHAVYLFTDGVTDQIGGPRRLPYGRKRLRAWLERCSNLPMREQREALEREFESYKRRNAQRDDVTVLGFAAAEILENDAC